MCCVILTIIGLYRPIFALCSGKGFTRRLLIGRVVLMLFLLPPLVWAMSEGRIGAHIRIRDDEANGTAITGRWLGKVDLKGISLKMVRSTRYGHIVETLIGAKKGELLRIDGFVDSDRQPLSTKLLERYPIAVEESVALPGR
ncbi:MAG: hypothetical protein HQM09_13765 [Candidatus Riflebacteria bacterium]|nr:hypothetical protein [Candidatus Riflebacteria bacterium]